MKLLIIAAAIAALVWLEPRPIYLDGVVSRVVRADRKDWRHLTPSEAMLIGAPRSSVTVWP